MHRISQEEAAYKLCKGAPRHRVSPADLESVKRVALGPKGVPYVSLHDGRTIRYPDPSIRVNDSVKIILPTRADGGAAAAKGAAAAPATAVGTSSATIEDIIPFQTGALATVTGGRNMVSVLATPIQLTRAGPDWHDRLARPPPGFVSRCQIAADVCRRLRHRPPQGHDGRRVLDAHQQRFRSVTSHSRPLLIRPSHRHRRGQAGDQLAEGQGAQAFDVRPIDQVTKMLTLAQRAGARPAPSRQGARVIVLVVVNCIGSVLPRDAR